MVLFTHQWRFYRVDAQRYKSIYESLTRGGELFLAKKLLQAQRKERKVGDAGQLSCF